LFSDLCLIKFVNTLQQNRSFYSLKTLVDHDTLKYIWQPHGAVKLKSPKRRFSTYRHIFHANIWSHIIARLLYHVRCVNFTLSSLLIFLHFMHH